MKTVLVTALLSAAGIALGAAPAAPLAAEQPAATAGLAIRFEGIEAPTGAIMLSVYDDAAAHDGNGRPARVAMVPVKGPVAVARFEGLAPGEYAVKAFHDVDGDGKMGTNPFGMPIEPYAFSNNAKPEGAPPRWEAARFAVAAGENAHVIAIK